MNDFEFVVSDGQTRGQVVAFPSASFVIGSGADCAVRFAASQVQPRHASIEHSDGQVRIKDLTGSGLLWVNGQPSRDAELLPGTFIRLGRLELVVRQSGRTGPSGTMAAPTPDDLTIRPNSPAPSGKQAAVRSTGPLPLGAPSVSVSPSALHALPLEPGIVIHGRYRILGKLAAGGMGEVYRAEHVELGKAFAVKVMRPELSTDPEFVTRFKREAVAASRIGQQNIIDITDFGQTDDGRFFFAMEFLEGLTLASLVHRFGALPLERALNMSAQVARALAAAHALSIVHRDLKPENVMVLQRPGQSDFVKVLDFGVAKVSSAAGGGQGGQTALGVVVGTPQYMSPEQAKGLIVDARTDIYALGLIIYELVSGRPVFIADTPSMLLVKHVTETPPPLQPGPLADVPTELEDLIFSMLAKDPGERPQMVEDVAQNLEMQLARLRLSSSGPTKVIGRASGGYPAAVTATATPVSSGRVRATNPELASVAAGPSDAELSAAGVGRSKIPLAAAAAGVLLLASLGGWFFLRQPAVVQPAPLVQAVTPPTLPPAPVDVLPQVVADVKLTVTSVPRAEVVDGAGVSLGMTPLTLQQKPNSELDLRFKAAGHQELSKKVRFVSDAQLEVRLEPVKKKPGSSKPPVGPDPDIKDSPY